MLFCLRQASRAHTTGQLALARICSTSGRRLCASITHLGDAPSVMGVFGTNTGAERCSAPISEDSALESFNVGVVIVLHISRYACGRNLYGVTLTEKQ